MLATTTPISSWIVEVYLSGGSLLQNVTITNPNASSTVLSSLNIGTVYLVRVAGINTRGIGNFTSFGTGQTFTGIFTFFTL